MTIEQLCERMARKQASDLFVSVGRPASMRVAGVLCEVEMAPVTEEDVRQFIASALPSGTWERLQRERDLDAGVRLADGGRYRVNFSFQRGNLALAVRQVPSGALDHRRLLIPDTAIAMADAPRGLILVTGATGSGKSTTMAAMLHHLNLTASKHIVTIEDPIEFAHDDIRCVISQREVGMDTRDFASALRHVVRQNPDVIFLGEIRDVETLRLALDAALTGHLVAATMHTIDVAQTVERILGLFPEDTREQVASDLAQTLVGIVSQRLVPRADGQGRAPAFELLLATPLARRLIAAREQLVLPEVMKGGVQDGMTTFNRNLLQRVREGLVTQEDALAASSNRDEFMLLCQGMETGIDTFRSYSADPDQGISIKKLLGDALHYGASDLLLTVGTAPTIRLDGRLRPFDMPKLLPGDTRKLLFSVLSYQQRADFEQNREIDFALTITTSHEGEPRRTERFRVNGFYQRGAVAAAFRLIPTRIPTPVELGLPSAVVQLCARNQGLILVTGPTGSGKSTTLAALIGHINATRACHVITVEDPIEFVHEHNYSLIEQREVHADTLSFANALKYVLRQDPDVILIGEMRDPETIATALTAAETGHLVFATLHTNDATQSVDRIIDVFPADRQNQIRSQLAACLEAVISQRLIKRADQPTGRIAAFEVLIGTTAVHAMIRERKTHQLRGAMESSAAVGMITMERALQQLLQAGKISQADFAAAMPVNLPIMPTAAF